LHLQAHECVKGEWRAIKILQTFVNAAHARTSTSGQNQACHTQIVHLENCSIDVQ
jgi:hypothetical protein